MGATASAAIGSVIMIMLETFSPERRAAVSGPAETLRKP